MEIEVMVANQSHTVYAQAICDEIYISSLERKTGIANRTPEYICEKILAGKAVIALTDDGRFVELQGCAEHKPFGDDHLMAMIALAKKGLRKIFKLTAKA